MDMEKIFIDEVTQDTEYLSVVEKIIKVIKEERKMKAFEMIKTLFDGWLNLEQGGVFVMEPEKDKWFFGENRVISGTLIEGEYVYFYGPEHDKLAVDYPPDVVLVTKDDESIMLWRVER